MLAKTGIHLLFNGRLSQLEFPICPIPLIEEKALPSKKKEEETFLIPLLLNERKNYHISNIRSFVSLK